MKTLAKGFEVMTRSAAQTQRLAARLGRWVTPGTVIALTGELGSGKTTFVQGLARGLGVRQDEPVASPTFVLIHEYHGRLPLAHVDLYRLDSIREIEGLGLEEYMEEPWVCVIEWAEKGEPLLPKDRIEVHLSHRGLKTRGICFVGMGHRARTIVRAMNHEV